MACFLGPKPAGCVISSLWPGCGLSDYHPRRGRSGSDRHPVSRCIECLSCLQVEMTKSSFRSFLSPVAFRVLRLVPVGRTRQPISLTPLSERRGQPAGCMASCLSCPSLIKGRQRRPAGLQAFSALLSVNGAAVISSISCCAVAKAVTRWLTKRRRTRLRATASRGASDPSYHRRRHGGGFIAPHSLHGLAGILALVALTYIAVMFIVVMTQPADVDARGDCRVGARIFAAIIIASLTVRAGWRSRCTVDISLPKDVNAKKLPLLERPHFNTFVPACLAHLRLFPLLRLRAVLYTGT